MVRERLYTGTWFCGLVVDSSYSVSLIFFLEFLFIFHFFLS